MSDWNLPARASGQLELAALFSDHAVLQRETTAPIWGWTKPGAVVTVRGSWSQAPLTTVADATGRFEIAIQTPAAGGPHELMIANDQGDQKSVRDLHFGEVWLMGGQSNMEWPIAWCEGGHPRLTLSEVVRSADSPAIRYFSVPKSMAPMPVRDVDARWQVMSSESVEACSAVGFWFAKKLHEELGVPVGLINAAYGGSEIEQWILDSTFRKSPEFAEPIRKYETRLRDFENQIQGWVTRIPAAPTAGWTKIGGYLSQRVTGNWGHDGLIWYRAEFTAAEAGEGTLELGPIDYADRTSVNGSVVGSAHGENKLRNYEIKFEAGKNQVEIVVLDLGGVGGLADASRPKVRTKAGDSIALENFELALGPELQALGRKPLPMRRWSRMWNGMIAPLVPYAIRGFAWYQGESNVSRGVQYANALRLMVDDWQRAFGEGKPFGIVQIAPFSGYGGSGVSAEVRESMARVAEERGFGLVVTTDLVDDLADIHPRNKNEVGLRLANWAMHDVYGQTEFPKSGPRFRNVEFDGATATLGFDFAEGLKTGDGQSPSHFTLAGEDRIFHPAVATRSGERLILRSDRVQKPVAVRFNWTDDGQPNVMNGAGLPMIPFRTDRWPLRTQDERW